MNDSLASQMSPNWIVEPVPNRLSRKIIPPSVVALAGSSMAGSGLSASIFSPAPTMGLSGSSSSTVSSPELRKRIIRSVSLRQSTKHSKRPLFAHVQGEELASAMSSRADAIEFDVLQESRICFSVKLDPSVLVSRLATTVRNVVCRLAVEKRPGLF